MNVENKILKDALKEAQQDFPEVPSHAIESIFRKGVEAKADVDQMKIYNAENPEAKSEILTR